MNKRSKKKIHKDMKYEIDGWEDVNLKAAR